MTDATLRDGGVIAKEPTGSRAVALRRLVIAGAVACYAIGVVVSSWDPWNLALFESPWWHSATNSRILPEVPIVGAGVVVAVVAVEFALSSRHSIVRPVCCVVAVLACVFALAFARLESSWPRYKPVGTNASVAVSPDGRVHAVLVAELSGSDVFYNVALRTTEGLDRFKVVGSACLEMPVVDFLDNRTLEIATVCGNQLMRFDKNLNPSEVQGPPGRADGARGVGQASAWPSIG